MAWRWSKAPVLLSLCSRCPSRRCSARRYSLSSVAGRAETSLPRCLLVNVFECFRGKPVPERAETQGASPPPDLRLRASWNLRSHAPYLQLFPPVPGKNLSPAKTGIIPLQVKSLETEV